MDESALLIKKLHESDYKDSLLYQCDLDAESRIFETDEDAFNAYKSDIAKLEEHQYDFGLLTTESKLFGVNRSEYKKMCDIVCTYLGDQIQNLCTASKIIVSPIPYEDHTRYMNSDLVIYGKHLIEGENITYDGDTYVINSISVEETPYYTVYCGELCRV